MSGEDYDDTTMISATVGEQANNKNKPRRLMWAISMILLGIILGVIAMVFVQPAGIIATRTPSTALIEECRKQFDTVAEQEACVQGSSLSQEKENETVDDDTSYNLDQKGFSILAFGGANTEGSGVEDPTTQSYPALLSLKVSNLAHASNGPNMASVCFDGTFAAASVAPPDVIVLEFWLRFDEGLALLAQRLRDRFPNAFLIFIKDWSSPRNFRKDDDENSVNGKGFVTFADWFVASQDDFDPDADVVMETKAKLSADADEAQDWYVPPHPNADTAIDDIAKSVGAVPLEQLTAGAGAVIWDIFPEKESGYETLMEYLEYYKDDHLHLNEAGHEKAAKYLLHIIKKARPKKMKAKDNGPLGSDDCHFWNYEQENIPSVLNNLELSDTPGHHHDVLELQGATGYMTITNPLQQSSPLYLSYHIDQEEGYLPPEVTVEVSDVQTGAVIVTDVLTTVFPDQKHSQIRTAVIGEDQTTVAPGQEVKVVFTASAAADTINKFQLSGYTFADTTPMEWDFAPKSNGVHHR
mmetsp:Transcript_29040/g.42842  ORF Transcript_29040/g.42842 Transcript_29040/m.42842 type:complete len:525 (-) Transcript_29040:97-1671(-)|eukprot:CAMPEP_0194218454 /NCGR_PEP_ID=MMETSP0156-20130528/23799_1 /TAXON_ID=33649 /ORGANISM="Thalassionema nitzschioides, Strain L26-B" /LENGTH=524 /DNA_ID=CAMNT_0038947819 /DNA_START=141 /DNA_END=1715 /DNA_ORIENTATION=+